MENELGKTIRILRLAKSLNIGQLAKKTGVSSPFISLVENGVRQPSVDVLRRLAEALEIPKEVLLTAELGCSIQFKDRRAADLVDAVSELIGIEAKLAALLNKDTEFESQGSRSDRHSDGDGG